MNYLWKNSKRVIVYEKKVPAWSSLDGWFWYHIDIKKNRIWCRQLRNVVNFSHAMQKPQRWQPLGFSCINETMIDIKKKLYGIPYSFMTCPGIEPGFTPWEGVVLTAWPTGRNRGDKIRTCDLCVPNAALYQTEPRLDVFKALCFVLFTSDSYIIAWPWKKCKRFFEKISIFWKKVFSANLPGSRKTSQSLIL